MFSFPHPPNQSTQFLIAPTHVVNVSQLKLKKNLLAAFLEGSSSFRKHIPIRFFFLPKELPSITEKHPTCKSELNCKKAATFIFRNTQIQRCAKPHNYWSMIFLPILLYVLLCLLIKKWMKNLKFAELLSPFNNLFSMIFSFCK